MKRSAQTFFEIERQAQAETYRLKALIVATYQHWEKDCGWCGKRTHWAVNSKHLLVCADCGH